MATLQEIEAKKQEIHSKGIAHFSINGLGEDESIARIIEESWSFFYVCVKDPYYQMKSKSGNIRFRIFQTLKDKPQIPMGYSNMPLFSFECFNGKPEVKAIEFIKSKVKNNYTYKVNGDEITCIRIIPDSEKKLKLEPLREAKEGALVFANWSNCYKQYKAKCEVIRVNQSTFRVKLLEEAGTKGEYGYYPVNYEIVIPKRKPTQQNCLTLN